jgi:hypothetical protein
MGAHKNAVVAALALLSNNAAAWDWSAMFSTKAENKSVLLIAHLSTPRTLFCFYTLPSWFTNARHISSPPSFLPTMIGRVETCHVPLWESDFCFSCFTQLH